MLNKIIIVWAYTVHRRDKVQLNTKMIENFVPKTINEVEFFSSK